MEISKASILHSCLIAWNMLPANVVEANVIVTFKKHFDRQSGIKGIHTLSWQMELVQFGIVGRRSCSGAELFYVLRPRIKAELLVFVSHHFIYAMD